jgi:hypothetical protein
LREQTAKNKEKQKAKKEYEPEVNRGASPSSRVRRGNTDKAKELELRHSRADLIESVDNNYQESKSPLKSIVKPGVAGKTNAKARKPKLVANLFYTKYPVVRKVLRKDCRMRLCDEDVEDFDLLWCDHVLANDRIAKMKPY